MKILFWSGGKDSYLALEFYRQKHAISDVTLLTTFNEETEVVPHQNIPINRIREQAAKLELDLITIPLPPKCPNEIYLERIEDELNSINSEIDTLIFGDWKLEDIRLWREREFGRRGYETMFPIWKKSIHDLLPVFILNPVEIRISAVQKKFRNLIRVGETYDLAFVRSLPREIDPMGENGEFHTEVIFIDLYDMVQ